MVTCYLDDNIGMCLWKERYMSGAITEHAEQILAVKSIYPFFMT